QGACSGEEAEWSGNDGIAIRGSGRSRGEPDSVSAGGAGGGVGGSTEGSKIALQRVGLRAQDIAPRVANAGYRRQDFAAYCGVLAREIQHGNLGYGFAALRFHFGAFEGF